MNLDAPRLVQPISGDFVATTKVTIYPSYNYQGAGLLIWQDADNYIRLERTLVSGIDMWYRIGGVYDGIEISFATPTVYLKFSRLGDTFTGWYSANGSDWVEVHTISYSAASTLQVGLVLINEWQDHPIYADFDFFELDWCASNTIVTEARLDIGMPYNTNRGCPSPYVGCGGPYHGFYNGVCTDLAMDAYNAGVLFNIQNALYNDHRANPGRYRYGTARNAEDMRRYFSYNQQLLPHSQTYQLGDIAFFDWNGDGLTNHVNIISEIDANGRPLRMVDATGIYGGNPGGRAIEHSWNSYYDQHIQAHGRLSGELTTFSSATTETLQVLRVAVDSSSVALRLQDANGRFISDTYDESLVASNVESFIPYIPGGAYAELDTEKVISVTQPLSNTTQYLVELTGEASARYHLSIQTLQNGGVTASSYFTESIALGETQGITLQLSASDGVISFVASTPTPMPKVSVTPGEIEMSGLPGTLVQTAITVAETGGQQALNGVYASISDVMNQNGQVVTGTLFTVAPTSFNVPAGGSQSIQLEINLAGIQLGIYQGSLLITSTNGGTRLIPLSLIVRPFDVFLPITPWDAP